MSRVNSKGFSLVELLVALAIIVVTVSMVSIGIGVLSSADSKAAVEIIRSELELERINSQAISEDFYVKISNEDKGIVVYSYRNGSLLYTKKLGSRIGINLSFTDADNTTTKELEKGDSLYIMFSKESGAVSVFNLNGSVINETQSLDGISYIRTKIDGGTNYQDNNIITFIIKGRKTNKLTLYTKTGLFK